jgi:hypothetical protein
VVYETLRRLPRQRICHLCNTDSISLSLPTKNSVAERPKENKSVTMPISPFLPLEENHYLLSKQNSTADAIEGKNNRKRQ